MKIAIIGAGVAGLAAAHRVHTTHPTIELVVYEKSRGVGGRVATRRVNGAAFDHGAQYIKTPTDPLRDLLTKTLPHENLGKIAQDVWTFDRHGTIRPGDPEQNHEERWSYDEGLTGLPKALAKDIAVRLEQHITRLAPGDGGGWTLWADDVEVDRADAVLLTPPAPQTAELLRASALDDAQRNVLLGELDKVAYRPCLTVTLGYPRPPRPQPFYALVNTDKQHPISWVACEHRKPNRDTDKQGVYVVQMAPQWSQEHWEDQPPTLAQHAADLLSDLLKVEMRSPKWSNRQGWRYALPDGRADFAVLNAAVPGLFFAGDYTAGQGRVHLAIEQGWAVAELLTAKNTP